MPGFFYYAVWAVAAALLGKGALDKMARSDSGGGVGTTKLFEAVDFDAETRVRIHDRKHVPISIRSERVVVCSCNNMGLDCHKRNGCFAARRVLVDTGASMTCIGHSLASKLDVTRSITHPTVNIQGVNSNIQVYKVGWVEVVVRGISKKIEACVFKRGQFDGDGPNDHDVLLGRDFMAPLFEEGFSIGGHYVPVPVSAPF